MMRLGIFAKTFTRGALEEVFAAVKARGLDCLQFNFSCAGLPTLPEHLEPGLCDRIRTDLAKRSIQMAAVSGTCNLIHPQFAQRERNLVGLEGLIRACHTLGTSVVTLCTGTRDVNDMWRGHLDNSSPEAWHDLTMALDRLLPVAQETNVFLGVEPEPANVIDSAPKARRLLEEMRSPWLKIVFDAANLLRPQMLTSQALVLRQAIDLLGTDIVIAHAKDLPTASRGDHLGSAQNALDYHLYLSLLESVRFEGPLILHDLQEDQADTAVAFVRNCLQSLSTSFKDHRNAISHSRQS